MDNLTRRQRFLSLSTPEVSDALEYFGIVSGLAGLRPSVREHKLFGPAFTVAREANRDPDCRHAADYVDQVAPGDVVVVDNMGLENCTCWGGILTHYARKKGLEGTVLDGMHRDSDVIRNAQYPVFSRGAFMVTGKGRTRLKDLNVPIYISGVKVSPGDFLFGDEHGVVVIPARIVNDVGERAEATRAVEREILEQVLRHDVPLKVARERLGYHDLTRPHATPRGP
jgi:4-hydroxy-4-methyl-2-oxoglutarate aldolase